MKRTGVISLILLMLLTGCSGASEIERGMALRSALLQAEGCSFEVQVKADYGEMSHSFSLECQFDRQGEMTFSVLTPETIAGITGQVGTSGGKLTFEDTALYFEPMTDDQISPILSPWILMKTLRSGYLTSGGIEDGLLRLSMDDSFEDDALHVDIWLDQEDIPLRGEIVYDGRRIVSMEVANFRIL